MPFSFKDMQELNSWGVELWFKRYGEFLSCFRVEGEAGLKEKMDAYYSTTGHGEDQLNALAANLMSEKEVLRAVQINPDIDLPNYDQIYLTAVSRIASEAFLILMERGVLEEIQLTSDFPELAQQQYDALVREAHPVQQAKKVELDLKQFAKDYELTPSNDLRPKSGKVRVNGKEMLAVEFDDLFSKACAAGLVRG